MSSRFWGGAGFTFTAGEPPVDVAAIVDQQEANDGVPEARLKVLLAIADEPTASDPVGYLHKTFAKIDKRLPVNVVAKLSKVDLRRFRRAAAKELATG